MECISLVLLVASVDVGFGVGVGVDWFVVGFVFGLVGTCFVGGDVVVVDYVHHGVRRVERVVVVGGEVVPFLPILSHLVFLVFLVFPWLLMLLVGLWGVDVWGYAVYQFVRALSWGGRGWGVWSIRW